MNENFMKVCRICLAEGSRNIFQKTLMRDNILNVSSLNRISEKLRFVTLLKIDENENIPHLICDLCIVQLNVAYNFKRQAIDSDSKIRQYLIENGINLLKDQQMLMAPPLRNTSMSSSSVYDVSTTTIRDFATSQCCRILPIRVKIETPEIVQQISEHISPSTISPMSCSTSNLQEEIIISPNETVNIPNTAQKSNANTENQPGSHQKSNSPSMVILNKNTVANSSSLNTDEAFVQTYIPTPEPEPVPKSNNKGNMSSPKSATERTKNKQLVLQKALIRLKVDMVNGTSPDPLERTRHTKPRTKRRRSKKSYFTKIRSKAHKASKLIAGTIIKQEMIEKAVQPEHKVLGKRKAANLTNAEKMTKLRSKILEEKSKKMKKSNNVNAAEDKIRTKMLRRTKQAKLANVDAKLQQQNKTTIIC